MPSWPADWIVQTLNAVDVPATQQAIAIMRAWKNSTPLPPMTNNPVGMPAGSSGAPAYLNTPYAIFPSMNAFYASFAAFASTQLGKTVVSAIASQQAIGGVWGAISHLNWPASKTETDYPALVLDMASQSYRDSVNATPAIARKTSGVVGSSSPDKPSVLMQAALVNQVVSTTKDARTAVRAAMARGVGNGG